MKNKPVIGCDIDGVILDFYGHFIEYVNRRLGTDLSYEDCTHYNLAIPFNVSGEVMNAFFDEYQASFDNDQLEIIDEAETHIHLLQDRFDIAIITSRPSQLEQATRQWFEHYFPLLAVHFAKGRNNPYFGENQMRHKPQMAEALGAFCLIEDNTDEFIHWDSDIVKPICFAQPWNKCLAETHPHIPRLRWPGVTELLLA